jgi:hypothetical protein
VPFVSLRRFVASSLRRLLSHHCAQFCSSSKKTHTAMSFKLLTASLASLSAAVGLVDDEATASFLGRRPKFGRLLRPNLPLLAPMLLRPLLPLTACQLLLPPPLLLLLLLYLPSTSAAAAVGLTDSTITAATDSIATTATSNCLSTVVAAAVDTAPAPAPAPATVLVTAAPTKNNNGSSATAVYTDPTITAATHATAAAATSNCLSTVAPAPAPATVLVAAIPAAAVPIRHSACAAANATATVDSTALDLAPALSSAPSYSSRDNVDHWSAFGFDLFDLLPAQDQDIYRPTSLLADTSLPMFDSHSILAATPVDPKVYSSKKLLEYLSAFPIHFSTRPRSPTCVLFSRKAARRRRSRSSLTQPV